MSDSTPVEEEKAAPEPIIIQKKQSFLVPAVVAALLLGGGFLVGNMFTGATPAPTPAAPATEGTSDAGHSDGGAKPYGDPAFGKMVDLGSQYVNLADGHFLKVSVSAMYDESELKGHEGGKDAGHSKEGAAAAPFNLAPARDTVLVVFSNMTITDLSAPDGRTTAKNVLLDALQDVYGEDIVTALYFSEFVWE